MMTLMMTIMLKISSFCYLKRMTIPLQERTVRNKETKAKETKVTERNKRKATDNEQEGHFKKAKMVQFPLTKQKRVQIISNLKFALVKIIHPVI